jgi:hypothetical protein
VTIGFHVEVHMKVIARYSSIALVALVAPAGCGHAAAADTQVASPSDQQLAPPPPPPTAPPPDTQTAPAVEAAPGALPAPSPTGSTEGPLPALPSSAPQAAPPAYPQPEGTPAAPVAQEAPPPAAQWVYSYPTGQWVFTSTNGWIWVPAGTATVDSEGVPYAYLYTPAYGWTWYVSPWGYGPYRYGVWVRHPFVPRGWHRAWVAHPRVVVRLHGRHRRW